VTSILDKLNLSPQERRLVVVVAIVVFVVLNIWLIWPEFGSVNRWNNRRLAAEGNLKKFKDEISNQNKYKLQLAELEILGGQIGTEEQALSLQRDVANQALLSGVQVNRYDPQSRMSSGGRTNAFFEEQGLIITVVTGEKELVDFLYNLGTRSSLIRVRSMTLSRDPTGMKLQGSMTLVASFAKKPAPKTAPAPRTTTNAPAVRPTAPRTNAPPRTNTPPPRLDGTRRT
jgi:Tfp pilus assembly protein PilO